MTNASSYKKNILKKGSTYTPSPFKAKDSTYDKTLADHAVAFIQCLNHTKGVWAGKPFLLLPWQERIIRDLFGIVKADGYQQFNTAYIEINRYQLGYQHPARKAPFQAIKEAFGENSFRVGIPHLPHPKA